ncbi:MAG: hypothetical protein EA352_00115 [Gemmatimonadales bacterium]|nr:MAG: hypothetical protein EA352_00115 [Gemmatimonadales bacterium]
MLPGPARFDPSALSALSPLSRLFLVSALVMALAACGGADDGDAGEAAAATESDPATEGAEMAGLAPEQEEFWANLEAFCGQAFAGEATNMREGDTRRHELYADREMVAHFRQCFDGELRIPGHIDDDRSRTWLLTRVDGGLDLRHDHRRPDGTDDDQTMYGAATSEAGTALRQEFTREGQRGYWVLELVPGERFSYGNHSGEEWLVRFDFDLNRPVDPPPAPWGYEDTEPHPVGS